MTNLRPFRVILDHPDTSDARSVFVQAGNEEGSQDAARKLMRAGERVIAVNEIRSTSSPHRRRAEASPGAPNYVEEKDA